MKSIVCCAMLLSASAGCCLIKPSRGLVVIPADKVLVRIQAEKPFTSATPGYFVPDAAMKEILELGLIATNALPAR